MSWDPTSLYGSLKTGLQIAAAFSAMIFIHELGHFSLLKFFKVKVHEFSLGFLGKVVGFRMGGTLYKIAWVPFGGYVKPEGEFSENDGDPIPPHSLLGLSWWKKALVYLAGPTMNLVGAVGILALAMSLGVNIPLRDPVVEVIPRSPASGTLLRTGDRILSVDGIPVTSFQEMDRIFLGLPPTEVQTENPGETESPGAGEALDRPAREHLVRFQRDGKDLEAALKAQAVIGGVVPAGPADKAGIRAGDIILRVAGREVPSQAGAVAALRESFGLKKKDAFAPVELVLRAEGSGQERTLSLSPEWNDAAARPLIGVEVSARTGLEPFVPPVVGSAKIGFPAREAGIKSGDRVLSVEGKELATFGDLEKALSPRGGLKTHLRVERAGIPHEVILEPIAIEGSGRIGITPPEATRFTKERFPLLKIPGSALGMTLSMAKDMMKGLYMLITGQLPARQSLSGPLTIGRMMKQEAQAGWQDFLQLIAALNIMLGVINLLPVPVVDGGEIAFCLLEGALGRRIRVKTYMFFKQAGFFLLIGLMVFVMWNDVTKLLKEWLRPQIF